MVNREELNQRLQHLITVQARSQYKKAWVWYKISTEPEFQNMTLDDVQYIGQQLGYKEGWAWYKYREFDAKRAGKADNASCHTQKNEESTGQGTRSNTYSGGHRRSTKDYEEIFDYLRNLYQQYAGIDKQLELLGLRQPFTTMDLKRAHRDKVKTAHPDVGGNVEKFRSIQKAYEDLKKHAADYKAS